jgi:DNA-binding transcriptional MerR regulator
MDERPTIGEGSGTQVVTIRYYEQAGLVPVPPRSPGNYRAYAPHHLHRLRFIRWCRNLGSTLDQVRDLLRLDLAGLPAIKERSVSRGHPA